MGRLLTRRDSPLMARLLAGLGPRTHWTSRLFEAFWFVVVLGVVWALTSVLFGGSLRATILPWMAFSILTSGCTNALQAVPRLRQTQQEQALLVLLPGVPRGARLNRWLAWQMSLGFVLPALCGIALAWALDACADAMEPGAVARSAGGITLGIAVGLLPQVVWQWRRWAQMRESSPIRSSVPVLTSVGVGMGLMAFHWFTGVGYPVLGIALAAVAGVYCAWRWWRMGSEASALPVGRLA